MDNELQCRIERPYLMRALKGASRLCGPDRVTCPPILRTVRFESASDRVHVTGTDLDSYATLSAPAQGGAFAVAVSPESVLRWLDQLGGDAVEISVPDASHIEFRHTTGRYQSRFVAPTLPASDFPAIPAPGPAQPSHSFTANADSFRDAVNGVLPFCAKPSRHNWHLDQPALFLHVAGQDLHVAAGNGVRLGHQIVPLLQSQPDSDVRLALAPDTMRGLAHLLRQVDDIDASVKIAVVGKTATFSHPAGSTTPLLTVTTRLLDATLDLDKVMATETEFAGSVTVQQRVLSHALQRLKRIARDDGHRVELHVSDVLAALCAHSSVHGSSVEALATTVVGPDIEIGFDFGNLNTAVRAAKGDGSLTLEYQASQRGPVQIAGSLVSPITTRAVEDQERAEKRAAQEAVAAGADIAALADGVVATFVAKLGRNALVDLTAVQFESLVDAAGRGSAWPDELAAMPSDLRQQVQQQVGYELEKRGVIAEAGGVWRITNAWVLAALQRIGPEEPRRREQARHAFRAGADDLLRRLRSSTKIDFVRALTAWYCGAQEGQDCPRGYTLSHPDQRDLRDRVQALVALAHDCVVVAT